MAKPKVGEILVRSGLIDEMQLRAALGDQRTWGQPLGMTLVKMGVIEERDLVRALAEQLHLPIIELEGKRVEPEVLELVPADFAEEHLCVPLFVREKGGTDTLHVGMEDPTNVDVIDDLCFRTGLKVQPVMVSPSELCEAIDRFYRRGDSGSGDFVALPAQKPHAAGVDASAQIHESLYPEISASPGDSGTLELCEEAPGEEAASAAPPEAGDSTNRTILRALCHLLIEKGVIEREELQALVASLSEEAS